MTTRLRASFQETTGGNNHQKSKSIIQQQRDIVIVGGGLAGLSAALYCSVLDPSRHVTIYDEHSYDAITGNPTSNKDYTVASRAAAGMLAKLHYVVALAGLVLMVLAVEVLLSPILLLMLQPYILRMHSAVLL